MHRRQAADHRVVADLDVPGQRAVVGKNHVVAHDAIVRDVAVGEEVAAVADPRHAARRGRAVDRDELAERVARRRFPGGSARPRTSNPATAGRRTRTDKTRCPRPMTARPRQHDVAVQPAAVAERHACADDAVRADCPRPSPSCARRVDDRRGMDLRRGHADVQRAKMLMVISAFADDRVR